MTHKDRYEFKSYCRGVTDTQLWGVYSKERDAQRWEYADIAKDELVRRGIL